MNRTLVAVGVVTAAGARCGYADDKNSGKVDEKVKTHQTREDILRFRGASRIGPR